ncbi:hypothetical protein E2562_032715 [Oryza meyeriana var. granulata]|uniref:Uncharacterized protein n=1 Tax=Oryza meyeriana var. granulata TaxID=110450 RepID=A0A6G1ES29_9ORYZ|nr:hypothetical protein E2562_032715 [Oryza meyeriana var. granulata]
MHQCCFSNLQSPSFSTSSCAGAVPTPAGRQATIIRQLVARFGEKVAVGGKCCLVRSMLATVDWLTLVQGGRGRQNRKDGKIDDSGGMGTGRPRAVV